MLAIVRLLKMCAGFTPAMLLAACSPSATLAPPALPQSSAARTASLLRAPAGRPPLFANPAAAAAAASRLPRLEPPAPAFVALPRSHRSASFSWIFASDVDTGNVDVYDESDGTQLSQCANCAGFGLAVDRKNDDLAMGTNKGTVTVWHVAVSGMTEYAKLTLSGQAAGAIASSVAFDNVGNLYAVDWPSNEIDVFAAKDIKTGKDVAPKRTIAPPDFADVYFLATDGPALYACGYNNAMQDIVASVDGKNGQDEVLQTVTNSTGGFPGGIALDAEHNLIVNNQYGTITTYAPPYTGAAVSTFSYGFPYWDYVPISLDHSQKTLWAGNTFYVSGSLYTDAQANSYPLGSLGVATAPYLQEEYFGLALDPQTKYKPPGR
jgi:hypothetical protein